MDKFEFKLKAKQLNKLVAAKDYKTAMEVLETMDWSKSKDVGFLISAADIYETNGRYDEAIDVLLRAYEFSGNGRLITYKLTNLAIKAGNKEEAAAYYEEFVNVAPRDMERYALQYQVAKLNGEPAEKLIAILEKQREVDLDEEWSYELAELYHQTGRGEECVELCDEIMLYYALGHYVEKAGALKQLYQPLTPEQAELFDNPEKFEENLRRTQEEFRDKETIKTVNEHMAEEQEAPVEEPAQEEESFVIDISEEEAPEEEVFQEEMPEEIPADFDFASLVQPLDVMEETEDDLYFTEDGAEEEIPVEEEIAEEEPEEIVPIYEDEPVLYVDDDEEWMAEETPEEIHFEEDFEEESAEEPEEFVEEIQNDIPEAVEEAPVFDELPEIIPPFAVGAKAEPEEMTLAWQEVSEPAEEAEIREIFSQGPQDFYAGMDEVEPEETWKEEQERMLEETEQAVLSALEEEYEGQVLYADEEDFADESKAEEELEEELQEELEEAEEEFQEELEEAEEEFQEELEEAEEEFQEEETPEDDFPLNLQDELERMLEESEEEAEAEPEAEPEEEPEDDEDDDEDFFEDPEEEEEPEPVKDLMPKKTPHILVRTDYAEEGMKMAIEALKRLPDDVRPKAIAKTSGDKLNRKGIRGSYEQLQNKILIVQGAGALEEEVLGDIRQFIINPDNHCIAVLIDSSEKIGEVCMRDPALAALFTTDYEYYEYSPDELVAHGVDYAAEKGYTFDEMAMLALYAGVEDIISEADGSQWIQTEELVEYAIRKAEKKGFFSRGPKVGKDGKKILKEDHLF